MFNFQELEIFVNCQRAVFPSSGDDESSLVSVSLIYFLIVVTRLVYNMPTTLDKRLNQGNPLLRLAERTRIPSRARVLVEAH